MDDTTTSSNPVALIAAALGLVGTIALPLVLGVLAVMAGVYGEGRAKVCGWGRTWAVTGIALGALDIGVALYQMGRWG